MKRLLETRLSALTLVSIIITVFLIPRMISAQNSEWMNFTSANSGLPGNNITALAVDNQGNVWIGITPVTGATSSPGGLAKFDGSRWTVYNTSNSELPSDCVKDLVIDSQENIWVGTNKGLAKFDGSFWTVYNKDNSGLPSNMVTALTFDIQGSLWIGTADEGVVKFNGENWIPYNQWIPELPNGEIFTFAIDSYGNLWYATINQNSGLAKFNGTNWTVDSPFQYVRSLVIDLKGNLWVGFLLPLPGGLAKFDRVDLDWTYYSGYYKVSCGVLSLAVDSQNNIWVGTEYGLAKFDGSFWTVYNKDNSGLLGKVVQTLAIDSQGDLWIGTRDGLSVYREGGVILNDPLVAVEERDNTKPSAFSLSQNYPNPFNPRTEIAFGLSENSYVILSVFNALGQKVATLVDEKRQAGNYQVIWDGTSFPTGIYFYRLESQGFSETKKMLLMK